MAGAPSYKVVGAGSVAADADRANYFVVLVIKRQAAAEDIHAADFLADHRIERSPIVV